jgi:hypothetical protein
MEEKKEVVLDNKPITANEFEEAKQNQAVRIIEDKNSPGHYKTLQKLHG